MLEPLGFRLRRVEGALECLRGTRQGSDLGHEAVHLAQHEFTSRADVFTHDALAWALAVAGRTTQAQLHATQALSEGTIDARLFLHAGIIAALNNDITQAKRRLQQASVIQQMLLPSERAQLEAWRQKIGTKQKE